MQVQAKSRSLPERAPELGVTNSFDLPAEHGAWVILLAPFFCAAGVAARWNASLLLCGICVLSSFIGGTNFLCWASSRRGCTCSSAGRCKAHCRNGGEKRSLAAELTGAAL